MGDTAMPTRRAVLAGLGATAALPVLGCRERPGASGPDPMVAGFDAAGVDAVAASYAAATSDAVGRDAAQILFPKGRADVAAIRRAVAEDFAQGRVFVHAGWRLSHTEGRLFALLARAPR